MAESDAGLAHLIRLFEGLDRLAPGSTADTARMIAALPPLPARPRVADVGCGAGAAAMVLAEMLPEAQIIALDLQEAFLTRLVQRAAGRAGVTGGSGTARLFPVVADMTRPPLADGSLDLVWSEGALYAMGFAAGVRAWARRLRPGGALAVTELIWLTETPPEAARSFFALEYPDIGPVAAKRAVLEQAGLTLLDSFVSSRAAWEAYYGPVRARLPAFRAVQPDDADAQAVADAMQAEIDLFDAHGDSYGYLAMVASTPRQKC